MIYKLLATLEVKANSMSIEDFNVDEITLTKVFKVDAETTERAFEYVKEQISCFCKRNNKTILTNHIVLMQDIMSYHNGHNRILVDKLNELWLDKKNHNNFGIIISALYVKYIEECDDKGIHIVEQYDKFYEDFVWDFLTDVCDDCDLETIIKFVSHT